MFELAKNKVQEIAGSFLLVIPKKWAQNKGVEKGDVLICSINAQGDLIISPAKEEGS